jgi:haloalkane dehalogenase
MNTSGRGAFRLAGMMMVAAFLTLPGILAAEDATPPHMKDGVRNSRYCEVLVIKRQELHLEAMVYNSLGLDDCPEAEWTALDKDALKTEFDALEIVLNGPRYFIMDSIQSSNMSSDVTDFQGIDMHEAATVRLPLAQAFEKRKAYEVTTIDRTTVWSYDKGQPTFQLVDDKGSVYVMQSYSQIVDPAMSYDQLDELGSRLKLPTGWQYQVVSPDTDLVMRVVGEAYVIQDDFENTYQRKTD